MFFVLHFISCVIDTLLFLLLLKYVVDSAVSLNKTTVGLVCAAAFIGAIIDTLTGGNIGIMSVVLLMPLFLLLFFKTDRVSALLKAYLFVLLLYFSLEIFSVFVELLLLSPLLGESNSNLRFLLVTIALNTLAVFGIWKICGRQNLRIQFTLKDKIMLFMANSTTFLILTSVVHFNEQILIKNTQEQILIIVLDYSVIFFYLFFVLFLVNGKVASYFKEIGQASQNHMMEQLKYFSSYKQAQEETRRFRHDMKNHLLYLKALSGENKIDEMKLYIQSLTDKWEDFPYLYSTGNDVVDTIINAKQFLFRENDIKFMLEGSFTSTLKMKPLDLCTVFSNALDNAIESGSLLSEGKERYTKLTIKTSHNYYLVIIENAVDSKVDIKNNRVVSSKADVQNHGFGFTNIEQALNTYEGYFKIKSSVGSFTLEIVFPR